MRFLSLKPFVGKWKTILSLGVLCSLVILALSWHGPYFPMKGAVNIGPDGKAVVILSISYSPSPPLACVTCVEEAIIESIKVEVRSSASEGTGAYPLLGFAEEPGGIVTTQRGFVRSIEINESLIPGPYFPDEVWLEVWLTVSSGRYPGVHEGGAKIEVNGGLVRLN